MIQWPIKREDIEDGVKVNRGTPAFLKRNRSKNQNQKKGSQAGGQN